MGHVPEVDKVHEVVQSGARSDDDVEVAVVVHVKQEDRLWGVRGWEGDKDGGRVDLPPGPVPGAAREEDAECVGRVAGVDDIAEAIGVDVGQDKLADVGAGSGRDGGEEDGGPKPRGFGWVTWKDHQGGRVYPVDDQVWVGVVVEEDDVRVLDALDDVCGV